jgi:hypothetical protein
MYRRSWSLMRLFGSLYQMRITQVPGIALKWALEGENQELKITKRFGQ